jgi:general secretion pathway protein A
MYTQFFGLREKPFSITPDPRYLYLSQRHADALAHLIYGISHSGGFIQLTGEVGTGKTTLVRTLFEQLPEEADVALILNPELTVTEFLAAILEELKVLPPAEKSAKSLIDALNRHLLEAHARGRRTVLIVDEAQNLAPGILEQVRLLTNLETPKQKLLQIILIGQPELRELLAREDMRQLAQRVTGRYHLEPLDPLDTRKYLEHRLKVAGASGGIFTPSAVREIYRRSVGIPRLINVIADRALLAAYTKDTRTIDKGVVRRAAAEVFGKTRRAGWKAHVAAAMTVAVVAGIGFATIYHTTPRVPPAEPALEQAAVEVLTAQPRPVPPPAQPVTETPVATEPAPPTLAAILADAAVPKDTDTAFATLFELWGAEYSRDAGPACEQAQRQLLRCLYQRGTLSHLRRVNRPAILSLVDADGTEAQIVLSRLDAESVTLMAGDKKYSVGVDELAEFWFGDHLMLWQPGNGGGGTLTPGSNGDGVVWLREALARIYAEPVPEQPSAYYDSALEARVRNFQRERRLVVDGIAGTQTQVVINSELAAPGTPLLSEGD